MVWTFGNLCPLKRRRRGELETASLKDRTPTIYFGNIFSPKSDDRSHTYMSHEALLVDGWEVD